MMDHLHPDQLAAIAVDPESIDSGDVEHLDDCARCAREVEVLRNVSERARHAEPDDMPPAPPEAIWDRVVRELSDVGEIPVPTAAELRQSAWRQPWAAAAALVLVVVLAAAALLPMMGDGGADGGDVVAEATLEPLAEIDGGSAVLTAEGDQRALRVDTVTLPAIDGYYELWLLAADGTEMVSLGPIDAGRVYQVPAAVDVDVFSVVDISREPADGDPTHSTDSVLRGGLEPLT
ncbi:MAG TPA: anti-sigma factor [Euzebyales bacterium]